QGIARARETKVVCRGSPLRRRSLLPENTTLLQRRRTGRLHCAAPSKAATSPARRLLPCDRLPAWARNRRSGNPLPLYSSACATVLPTGRVGAAGGPHLGFRY